MELSLDLISEEKYSIKGVYKGHTSDVRVVTPARVPEGGFITGSRDCLVKLWIPVKENEFKDEHVFMGATKFIASLCALAPSEQYPNGLILAGSNDCSIYGFTLNDKKPVMRLLGHSNVVCSLSSGFGLFVSGSWDKTARIWSGQQCTAVLEGHDQAVWATEVYPLQNMILTGSADRTIRIWRHGVCENVLFGHEDCVRGLVVTSNLTFLSCSNDGTVRLWNIQGQCLNIYNCHDNYIYSITMLNNGTDFATCSEDQHVKVWKTGLCVQSIQIASKTLWSITCLNNGDLVVGASDGSVYVIGKSTGDINSIKTSVQTGNLLSEENTPVNQDYEDNSSKKINNNGLEGYSKMDLEMFSSSVKEKDFELFIEIAGSLQKLAFNRDEKPSEIAQNFVVQHSLDSSIIPELIELIVKNSDLKYPLTPNVYFPLEKYYTYTNANVAGLKAKLLEFTACVPKSKHVSPSSIEKLVEVANFPDVVSESQMQSLDIAVSWSDEYLYPVLDLLRLAVRCKDVCRRISNQSFINHLLEMLNSEKSINRILVIKILCNLFGFEEGEDIMMKFQEKINESVKKAFFISDDKIHKSCLSLFLNYSIAAHKGLPIDVNMYCTNLIKIMENVTDTDCLYKGFLSIGTICVSEHAAFLKFESLNIYQLLLKCQKLVESDAVSEVLNILLSSFQP